jgi:hypothetical protein
MGQKVNPEIFRLERLNNNWKSKYTENKKKETSAFFFKSLEIKNFIKRFSRFHGLAFHNCKLALSNTSLHLFVSYYTTKHSTIIINRESTKNNDHRDNENTIRHTSRKISGIIRTLTKTYCRYFKTTRLFKTKKSLKKQKTRVFKKTRFYKKLRNFKKKNEFQIL